MPVELDFGPKTGLRGGMFDEGGYIINPDEKLYPEPLPSSAGTGGICGHLENSTTLDTNE